MQYTYTFETADLEQIGSSWGIHRFMVVAHSRREAWDKVRQLTPLALVIITAEPIQ